MATDGIIRGEGNSRLIRSPNTIPTTFDAFRAQLIESGLPVDLLFNPGGWQVIGDFLNKLFFLTDTTETQIWGNAANRTVNEALAALAGRPISSHGTCTTAAAAEAKQATVGGDNWRLIPGAIVGIAFSEGNIAVNPTLDVNGTGAVDIIDWRTSLPPVSGAMTAQTHMLMYSGSQWVLLNPDGDIGAPYGICSSSATAKTVTISGLARTAGALISVRFTYAVQAGATLNVNNMGAVNMRIGAANIAANVINAGDTALILWTGSVWQVMAVDKGLTAKPYIVMTYTGNSNAVGNTRTITTVDENGIAFTPSAVLVIEAGYRMLNNSNGEVRGGLAVTGRPVYYDGSTSYPAITITTNGFIVYISAVSSTGATAAATNRTGLVYTVIAFK